MENKTMVKEETKTYEVFTQIKLDVSLKVEAGSELEAIIKGQQQLSGESLTDALLTLITNSNKVVTPQVHMISNAGLEVFED
ncbi:MAG: hypothetical protein ACI35O_08095 [Bacillaceae bacterium]